MALYMYRLHFRKPCGRDVHILLLYSALDLIYGLVGGVEVVEHQWQSLPSSMLVSVLLLRLQAASISLQTVGHNKCVIARVE